MRSLRLPWHRNANAPYAEPALHQKNVQTVAVQRMHRSVIDDLLVDVKPAAGSNDREGGDAVFGVVGTWSPDVAALAAPREAERAEDVIEALHAQYWRTLMDPHALMAGQWASQSDERSMHPGDASADAGGGHDARNSGSIEVLLSGERSLEACFGPLESGPALAMDIEPVPEILRLFAPPEYHAAATRRPPSLPPVLTRREHHALSVDSPLPAPLSAPLCQHEK
jgi:hypothetical protein